MSLSQVMLSNKRSLGHDRNRINTAAFVAGDEI